MYDALKLCATEERGEKVWHIAAPADVIPPTLKRIQEVLATKWQVGLPPEIINFDDDDPSIAAKNLVIEVRDLINAGQPNTAAWVWFKRALAMKVRKPILLHITADPKFKE